MSKMTTFQNGYVNVGVTNTPLIQSFVRIVIRKANSIWSQFEQKETNYLKQKTGKLLWETIEDAARKKHDVGEEFVLTMADLGHPQNRTLGECEYRINNDKDKKYYRGFVSFDPYVNE